MTETLMIIGLSLVVSALAELYVATHRQGGKRRDGKQVLEDIQ